MANTIQNMQVKDAGFYYIGHFNAGELRIIFQTAIFQSIPQNAKKCLNYFTIFSV